MADVVLGELAIRKVSPLAWLARMAGVRALTGN
jgi:hypothetical protein